MRQAEPVEPLVHQTSGAVLLEAQLGLGKDLAGERFVSSWIKIGNDDVVTVAGSGAVATSDISLASGVPYVIRAVGTVQNGGPSIQSARQLSLTPRHWD